MDEKIEEIAKELCPYYDNGNCYYEVTEVSDCCCNCEFCWAVSQVLKAGYRKIPELPKETVLTADDIAELLTIVARDTRKETARKFKKMLKELVAERNCNEDYDWEDVQVDGQIFVECVDEICKEIAEGKV